MEKPNQPDGLQVVSFKIIIGFKSKTKGAHAKSGEGKDMIEAFENFANKFGNYVTAEDMRLILEQTNSFKAYLNAGLKRPEQIKFKNSFKPKTSNTCNRS